MLNLVWWELARLARRGHAARARILLLYALLLGIGVFAFLDSSGPLPLLQGNATLDLKQADRFSRQLVFILLEAQLLGVALITPAYAVAAISEEKDRQTLSLLLTTSLSDRQIVWGKTLARVLTILAAVVCGIPIIAFTQMFGGVHLTLIAVGYTLTITTVVLCAAIGINAAASAPNTRQALIRAYLMTVLALGCVAPLVPFFALYLVRENPEVLSDSLLHVGIQLAVGWILLLDAAKRLRKPGETAGSLPATAFPEPPQGRAKPVLPGMSEPPPRPMPALGVGDPVLWKERHAKTQPVPWASWLMTLPALVAVGLFIGGGWLLLSRTMRALDPHAALSYVHNPPGTSGHAGFALMLAGVIAGAIYLVPLVIGITDCIAGERLRGTLDSLLVSLLDRRQLLWAKVRIHAEHWLGFAVWATASLGAAFGSEGEMALGFAMMAAFAGGVVLVIGLGAWLSVRCPTPVNALRLCLPALLAVCVSPLLAWYFIDWENTTRAAVVLVGSAVAFALAGSVFAWRAGEDIEASEGA